MFSPSPLMVMSVVVLDLLLKDPHYSFHPVRLMGMLVDRSEGVCREISISPRIQGVLMVLGVEVVTVAATVLLLFLFTPIHMAWLPTLFLGYFALAGGALWQEIGLVGDAVTRGELVEARERLSFLVTRDTSNMDASEILRTAIESLAENTADAIVAPLLFFALGGVPLAFFYKAADTMDSMVGYKTPRYAQFGWAAARLDDLLNYLPARITALLVAIAGLVMGMGFLNTWNTVRRFAHNSPSPNSGYPEAAFAGALGVRLGGGRCTYFGEAVLLPPIGEGKSILTPKDLYLALDLSKAATLAAVVLAVLLALF